MLSTAASSYAAVTSSASSSVASSLTERRTIISIGIDRVRSRVTAVLNELFDLANIARNDAAVVLAEETSRKWIKTR